MPDPAPTALGQIEDAIAEVLGNAATLSAWTVLTQQTGEVAIEDDQVINVYAVNWQMEQADEQHMTAHSAEIEIEFVSAKSAFGALSRANLEGIAHAHAALAADRTLGWLAFDLQEVDIAPVQAETRDVQGTSIKYRVAWFGPRDDLFTISGY